MPPFPPITSRIVSQLQVYEDATRAFHSANPQLFAGMLAASVVAPLFMKNDERGYLDTATMTTPMIVSAALVAPRLIPAARKEGKRLIDVVKKVPTDYGFRKGGDPMEAIADGRLSVTRQNAELFGYFSTQVKSISSDQIAKDFSTLRGLVDQVYKDPSKRRLLENAIYRSNLSTASAAEKATWTDVTNVAPELSFGQTLETLLAHDKDSDWIRGMTYQLRVAQEADMPGAHAIPAMSEIVKGEAARPALSNYSFDRVRERAQASQFKTEFEELDTLLKDSKIWQREDIDIVSFPTGRNKALNSIQALRIGKEDSNRRIYIPFDYNGAALTGESLQNQAAARFFVTGKGTRSTAQQAIRALRYGNTADEAMDRAESEIGRSVYFIDGSDVALRNQQWVAHNRGVLSNLPNDFDDIKNAGLGGFNQMSEEEKLHVQKAMVDRGYIRTADLELDLVDKPEMALLDAQGTHARDYESLSVKAANQPGTSLVPEGREAFVARDVDGVSVPRFSSKVYELSDAQHAFFRELPEWSDVEPLMNKYGSMEVALGETGRSKRMIALMAKDAGVSEEIARGMWRRYLPYISSRSNYEAMKAMQYIGDGSRLMSRGLGIGHTESRWFKLHESFLTYSQLKNGANISPDTPFGMNLANAQVVRGARNRVIEHASSLDKDGALRVRVQSDFEESGTKIEGDTKQQILSISEDQNVRATKGMQAYLEATEQPGTLGQVEGFTLASQTSDKAKNPLAMVENQVAGTLRDLEDLNPTGGRYRDPATGRFAKRPSIVAEVLSTRRDGETYGQKLTSLGYEWNGRTLISRGQDNYTAAATLMNNIMDEAGRRVKAKQINLAQYMEGFADWSQKTGGSYLNYVRQFNKFESLSSTDHMALNHAGEVRITRDALAQLDMMGHQAISKEIRGRLKTDGLPGMTWDFMDHTEQNRDFGKAFGDRTLTLGEAVGKSADIQLGTAQGRAGTIFDPGRLEARDNFSVGVKIGDKQYYVPVLGHDALGGKVNEYGAAGYSANRWETALRDTLKAGAQGENYIGDPAKAQAEFEGQLNKYVGNVREFEGLNKTGVLRPEAVDPLGFEGRITARTSSLRYKDGSINPFEIAVGSDYLERLPRPQADALRGGEKLTAVALRHPINATLPVMVRYDENLGRNQVGMDQFLQLLMKGDGDGDRTSYHLVTGKHLAGEDLARFNAENILNERSAQGRLTQMYRAFHGDESLGSSAARKDFFSLLEKGGNSFTAFADASIEKSLIARTSGTNMGVGMSSNLFELMEASLNHNNRLTSTTDKMLVHSTLFDLIKQGPISAKKLKEGTKFNHFLELIAWNNEVRRNFNDDAGFGSFMDRMKDAATSFGKEVDVNDAHIQLGLATEEELGSKINPYMAALERRSDLFQDLFRGHAEIKSTLNPAQRLLNLAGGSASKYIAQGGDIVGHFVNNILPGIQAGARQGSKAAVTSAAGLGAENAETAAAGFMSKTRKAATGVWDQATRSAEEVIDAARGRGAGRVLKIGAGIAVASGLLFSSIHSPREGQALAPSGNAHRPEERIGVEDRIPGEPESGAMAPATPPRNVRPAKQGVHTTVMAPMGQASQLEVQMKADDRNRAAELSRIASRMASPDGNSQVTVNYQDGTRLDSLRTREKIREAMRNA